ncbi:MAG: hypothetical protein WBJ77_00020, partial [Bacillota bacterium]
EYICLACGAQGLVEMRPSKPETQDIRSGQILRCPKCQQDAFMLKRKAASDILVHAHVQIT